MPPSQTTPSRTHRAGGRAARKQQRETKQRRAQSVTGSALGMRLQPLSEADVKRVHQAALALLQRVGMGDPTPQVRAVAEANGCTSDDAGRLHFPPAVVEDLLTVAAKQFVVHGRDAKHDFLCANDRIKFCTGGAAVRMLDLDTREYRPSTLADLYDLARLTDKLENIQWFTRPVVATDVTDIFELDANTIYACAAGTQKHIATSITLGEHVPRLVPMLDALADGAGGAGDGFAARPFCSVHATNAVAPMRFARDSLDVTCEAVKIGMPIHSLTAPQAGATAPAALAGTLAQTCAEGLASLCIINMLQPGYPVLLGNWPFVSDLRTGAFSGGGGEQALLGAAIGQMARFYGVPGSMGAGMSDSKLPDNQAGFEKGLSLVLGALSGGGMVFESAGMLASLLGCSLEAMVIDNELLGVIHRIGRGIEVNEDTLSVEVVAEAVGGAGHFLGAAQTLELMESEYVYPRHADRATPGEWAEAGASDMRERAGRYVREVLEGHRPRYVDESADKKIRARYTIRLTEQQTGTRQ